MARNVGSDKWVTSAEYSVCVELFFDAGKGGVFPQVVCYLSAVFESTQAKVAVALLEHEVVCLHYLLRGGTERRPGICEARFGKCNVGIIFLAVILGIGVLDMGGNEGAPGRVVCRQDKRGFSVQDRLPIIV